MHDMLVTMSKFHEYMNKNYPGLRSIFTLAGFRVQSQDRYPLRLAIAMRGEQTLNKDARTNGGVARFNSSSISVQKVGYEQIRCS